MIDRDTNQAKLSKHAKYVIRVPVVTPRVITDNSAINSSVRQGQREAGDHASDDGHASYPGLGDYRHDPRVVGAMARHVVLPWSHRAFSLLKRWALGTYHGLRASTSTPISTNSFFATTDASTAMRVRNPARPRSNHVPTTYWESSTEKIKKTEREGLPQPTHIEYSKNGAECVRHGNRLRYSRERGIT